MRISVEFSFAIKFHFGEPNNIHTYFLTAKIILGALQRSHKAIAEIDSFEVCEADGPTDVPAIRAEPGKRQQHHRQRYVACAETENLWMNDSKPLKKRMTVNMKMQVQAMYGWNHDFRSRSSRLMP